MCEKCYNNCQCIFIFFSHFLRWKGIKLRVIHNTQRDITCLQKTRKCSVWFYLALMKVLFPQQEEVIELTHVAIVSFQCVKAI